MNPSNNNDILFLAEKTLFYNNLLIDQCNKWLSAEEGNRLMEKQIKERERRKGIKN